MGITHLVSWFSGGILADKLVVCLIGGASGSGRESAKWIAPPVNRYKLNVDATFDGERMFAGAGLIVHNHVGKVMAAAIRFHEFVRDSDSVEGWAVVDGLKFAAEMGFYPVMIETESKQVFEILRREKEDLSDLNMLVVDALEGCPLSWPLQSVFSYREGNQIGSLFSEINDERALRFCVV